MTAEASRPPVPKILDHYSLETGSKKTVTRDYRCLRVLRSQYNKTDDTEINLLTGFDEETYKNIYSFDIPHPIMHLRDNGLPSCFSKANDDRPVPFDFVATRGLFQSLLLSPDRFEEDTMLVAEKFENTIYLRESSGESSEDSGEKEDLGALKATYAGEFFEEAVTEPYTQKVNRSQATGVGQFRDHFYCLFANRIGPFSILYGGEIDALMSQESDPTVCENYVELKTKSTKLLSFSKRDRLHMALKLLWAQSVLSGMKETIVGFRDEEFVCRKLIKYQVDDLPDKCGFDWVTYFRALENFLHFVQSFMQFKKYGELCIINTTWISRQNKDYKYFAILDRTFKNQIRFFRHTSGKKKVESPQPSSDHGPEK